MADIATLKEGERFDSFFKIREYEARQSRAGRAYLDLTLEDVTGEVPAKVWEPATQVQGTIAAGDFIKVRAMAENYQGRLQLRVDRVRRVNEQDYESGFRPEDCVQRTPYDIDVMWEEAKRIAGGCHPLVAAYLTAILDAYEEKFREWPAAQRIHHPYLGGLLEHTLSVTKTCLYLADKYDVSKDLLVAGALLHDIGKLEELSTEGATHYTPAGRLLGHIVLGRDIAREWAGRDGVFQDGDALPEDFLLHLEHLILSHQGQPDWGTVKVPMSAEALLLHYADDMDAKFNILKRAVAEDTGDEDFTARNQIMARAFYKGGPPLPPENP